MSFHKFIYKSFGGFPSLYLVLRQLPFAQQSNEEPTPSTLVAERFVRDLPVATGNNLYCAGYIQRAKVDTGFEIVGADDEKDNLSIRKTTIFISAEVQKRGV